MVPPQASELTLIEHHKPELDGLRGVAILAVLLEHSVVTMHLLPDTVTGKVLMAIFTPGWSGVDLFFVLSGFLITGILLRTRESPNYYKSFYMRRFLRIFPLYYTMVTVFFLIGCIPRFQPFIRLHELLPLGTLHRISYYLYLQNWPMPHGFTGEWTGPYWSLAVEEQFYLVWPWLVVALKPRTMLRICIAGLIVPLALRILANYLIPDSFFPMWMTPVRMNGLLVGSACALIMYLTKRPVSMTWIRAALLSSCATLTFIAIRTHGRELLATGKWMQTIGVTAFALLSGGLLALTQHHPPLLQRVLTMRFLRSFGKYSYGIYVYHAAFFILIGLFWGHLRAHGNRHLNTPEALLMTVVAIAIAYLIAKLSFDYFEMRFLMLKRHFRATPTGH